MNAEQTRLWTAVVTPFLPDDRVDFESLGALLKRQDEAGNGVVLLGSTGEGLALSDSERREVVRFACAQGLKVPLMAGLGGAQLAAQLEWLGFCIEAGISAFLAPVPLYAKPGPAGQLAWFSAILDRSTKPVMLYNVPSRTGVKLSVATLKALGQHPQAWAVKEASGSVAEFLDYRAAAPRLRFFAGDDGLLPALASAGAEGLVSVASNVWPQATKRFMELGLAGEGPALFPLWKRATDALFTAANPIPVKALLAKKSWIRHDHLRLPLTRADLADLGPLVEADQEISRWFDANQG